MMLFKCAKYLFMYILMKPLEPRYNYRLMIGSTQPLDHTINLAWRSATLPSITGVCSQLVKTSFGRRFVMEGYEFLILMDVQGKPKKSTKKDPTSVTQKVWKHPLYILKTGFKKNASFVYLKITGVEISLSPSNIWIQLEYRINLSPLYICK